MRDVDRVTGSGHFDFVAARPLGIPTFEIGVDDSVASGYQHPAWFTSPGRRGDDSFEILSPVQHLRSRHEGGLPRQHVSCEVFVILRRVQVSKAVGCYLYRVGLTEVARKALAIVSLVLSGVRHVGRDIYESGDGCTRACFGNYRSPVAMSDKNARSILKREGALSGSHIVLKGCLWLLANANVLAILHEDVVNTLPARTICPRAVNQYDILYGTSLCSSRSNYAERSKHYDDCRDRN